MSLNVLIIEDEVQQRTEMVRGLKRRGFTAYGAADVEQARRCFEDHGKRLDVVVTDIRLEDVLHPRVTGLDLAQELKQQLAGEQPAFLIHSGYPESDFFKRSQDLGAVAFLQKTDKKVNLKAIMRFVRALGLKRWLDRDVTRESIDRWIDRSKTRFHALKAFCSQTLQPHFRELMGLPYFMLFNRGSKSRELMAHPGFQGLPDELWRTLSSEAFGRRGLCDCLEMKFEDHPLLLEKWPEYRDQLDRCDMMPLYSDYHVSLSLGIAKQDSPLADDPKELAKVLARYYQPALHNVVSDLFMFWGRRNEERRATLAATSKTMYYFANALKKLATDCQEPGNDPLQALQDLANELENEGGQLEELANFKGEGNLTTTSFEAFCPRILMEGVGKAAQERNPHFSFQIEDPGGHEIRTDRDIFGEIQHIVVNWFCERARDANFKLLVKIQRKDDQLIIDFKDNSPRLAEPIRKFIFAPFNAPQTCGDKTRHLSLYMARSLAEVSLLGKLLELTSEMQEPHGHHFRLQLPV